MSTSEEIYRKVARVLVDSLNVDEEDVTPEATLQGDLGAESIDFLDIVFRLEREFGIKIPRGELFPESIFQGDPDFVQDSRVTDKGMAELRSRMPYADLGGLDRDRRLGAVPDLFTVDLVARYVAAKR
jgi:acyl carrier protein